MGYSIDPLTGMPVFTSDERPVSASISGAIPTGGGGVQSVVAGDGITVNSTDASNPVISGVSESFVIAMAVAL